MSSVHVMYNGETHDLTFEDLFPADRLEQIGIPTGTEVSAENVTQAQVKTALSQHFDVGLGEFNDHFIEINPKTGNVTVRPEANLG